MNDVIENPGLIIGIAGSIKSDDREKAVIERFAMNGF